MPEISRSRRALERSYAICTLWIALLGLPGASNAQVSGPNVNVIGGPTFLTLDPFEIVGDPWQNQQVEAFCAVSGRNPAVLLCSAVDYRLVDITGLGDGVHTDSWNMIGQSVDGGATWTSRPHPGHSLDPLPNVLSDYDFGADPIVQAAAAGLFFHAGLVADRTEPKKGKGPPNAPGAIYVSTWVHLSDQEDEPEPIKLVEGGITLPAVGNSGQFRDRPYLAVGEPNGQTCTLEVPRGDEDKTSVTQILPATPAYLAFTSFIGTGPKTKTQMHFTKSDDCGKTWTNVLKLNTATASINVGAQIVPLPGSSRILVFWRRGASKKDTDAIMVARSEDGGNSFGSHKVFAEICPFDQNTSPTAFRVTTVASATAGPDRAYVVWADRTDPATGQCTGSDGTLNDARIVMATTDGVSHTAPQAVDPYPGPGHQLFPTVAFGERVHVAWLDFRNDASGVFQEYIDEQPIVDNDTTILPAGIRNRHTADMFAAEADGARNPVFGPSQQVSQYVHGKPEETPNEFQQLQHGVVHARNFDQMRVVFHGDYNATAAETTLPKDPVNEPGVWTRSGAPGAPPMTPVFHRFWTDGRNQRLLADEDYARPRPYAPVDLGPLMDVPLPPESLYDPTQLRSFCDPDATGTKDLDIYTSRSTHGFYAFAPWNNKSLLDPDNLPVQRAFVIVVQNTVPPPEEPPAKFTSFRLRIRNQPQGDPNDSVPEMASFEQFSMDTTNGTTIPAMKVDEEVVVVRAGSAIAHTVYVTSSNPRAAVRVDVEKLDELGNTVATRAVFLNPDPTAPPNPKRPGNVDQTDPDFDISRFEVHGIAISDFDLQDIGLNGSGVPHQGPEDQTVDWGTPRWKNPRWKNPRWKNVGWYATAWETPRWKNPRWKNDGFQSSAVSDTDALNGSRHIRMLYTSTANTTSSFDARVLANTLGAADRAYQLVVYTLDSGPGSDGCEPAMVGYPRVLVNIPDYQPTLANFTDPATSRETTFSLAPGDSAYVELIVHPTAAAPDPTNFPATPTSTIFAAVPEAVDTADIVPGLPVPDPPPVFTQPLTILEAVPPDGQTNVLYAATTLQAAGGVGNLSWSVDSGVFPPGLILDANAGMISGTPTLGGAYNFTIRVEDSDVPPSFALKSFDIDIFDAILSGFVRFNDQSIISAPDLVGVAADFFVRDEVSGQAVSVSPTYDTNTGAYSISLVAGTYGINVRFDAAAPLNGRAFALDYDGFNTPIVVGAGAGTVNADLEVHRTIHLTLPVDNLGVVGAIPPPFDTYASSVTFQWDAVPEAANYNIRVDRYQQSPFMFLANEIVTNQVGTQVTFTTADLPANNPNEFYLIDIFAVNAANTLVGKILVSRTNGLSFDYRFQMVP